MNGPESNMSLMMRAESMVRASLCDAMIWVQIWNEAFCCCRKVSFWIRLRQVSKFVLKAIQRGLLALCFSSTPVGLFWLSWLCYATRLKEALHLVSGATDLLPIAKFLLESIVQGNRLFLCTMCTVLWLSYVFVQMFRQISSHTIYVERIFTVCRM